MTDRITVEATFAVQGWDENPFKIFDGERRLTQANVTQTYQGDLQGQSEVRYLMSYTARGASFVGIEAVTATLNGRTGSFVLRHEGEDDGTGVRSRYFVVPGSGTGELEGLRGEGSFHLSGHAERYAMTLVCWFEE